MKINQICLASLITGLLFLFQEYNGLVVDPVVEVHYDVQCRRPEVLGPMFKKNRMCIMM